MSPDSAAVERAFRNFLAARGLSVNELILGNAFKVMLEFHQDVKFAWVGTDPEDDTLKLWWSDSHEADSSNSGFLGMFKTVTKGKLIGYKLEVSRDLWPLDEDSTDFVTLSVVLEYAVTNPEIAGFTIYNELIASNHFENLEAFVTGVFELNVFKALALEEPLSVKVTLELDGEEITRF